MRKTLGGWGETGRHPWHRLGRNRGRLLLSAFFLASGLGAFLHLFLQLRRSILCPLTRQTASYALIRTRRLLLVGKRSKYLAAHTHKKTLYACIPCSQASLLGKWNKKARENNAVGSSVTVAWAVAFVQPSPKC